MPLFSLSPDTSLNRTAIFWIALVHIASLAAIPFFSWPALAVCLSMLFIISPIGVTMTYHRMLTHRAFKVPRWLEYILAIVGTLSAQGSPLLWVAGHRHHHKYADTELDQHTPKKGFFYSHIGHLLINRVDDKPPEELMRYVPDMAKQRFYQFLHRHHLWIALSALPILYLFGGWSFVLWGGFVRVTLMLHITWLVNSATHMWGYRNFNTRDSSKNLWWVAVLAAGEGWHNNHHAEQSCAAHGRKWWEFDLTWMMIRTLAFFGLATHVRRPTKVPVPC